MALRSFDIQVVESEEMASDMAGLGSARGRCLRRVNSLTDLDTLEWWRLPLKRGTKGRWVEVPLGAHSAICQYLPPSRMGSGEVRGCLTVLRILDQRAVTDFCRRLLAEEG